MTTEPDTLRPSPRALETQLVELCIPAEVRHLRLARLTASGYAADLGFTMDEIEDLRLAVDEACALLIDQAAVGARLTLRYLSEPPGIVIEGRCDTQTPGVVTIDSVTRAVLHTTLDDFDVRDEGGALAFHLRKRSAIAPS